MTVAAYKELLRAAKPFQKKRARRVHLTLAQGARRPSRLEAHNDFGVWYMRQGAYEQAAAESGSGEAGPGAVRPVANLARRALSQAALASPRAIHVIMVKQ